MNNLPDEVIINIIHYAGKSAKFINSRFYEIALDCKWNYKLIDLSTITIEELKKLKHIEYIKVIVTKNRSKKELLEVIGNLFDINNFKLKGIYSKVPIDFKSSDEVEFFRHIINGFHDYSTYLKDSLVLQLKNGIQKQIYLYNLIVDFSEHTDSLDEFNENEIDPLSRFYRFFNSIFLNRRESDIVNLNCIDVKYEYHKINNFIYKFFPSYYKKNRKILVVNNDKDMFIDIFRCGILFDELYYKNMNIFLLGDDFKWLPIKSDINTPALKLSYNEMLERSFGTEDFNKILKLK